MGFSAEMRDVEGPIKRKPKKSTGSVLGQAGGRVARSTGRSIRRRSSGSSGSSGSSSRNYSSNGSSSRRRRSSGGSSGGSSRSYNPPAPKPKPKVAPKPPSIAQYLGTDSVYQQAVRGKNRSLADFLSELGRRRGEAGTQFNQTKSTMERDRVQQLEDLRQEFASRGLIQSGLYGQEQGRFQQQFTEQLNALQQQQAALLADIMSQEKNYRRESDLGVEQAKQEALMRRAQRYKIGA